MGLLLWLLYCIISGALLGFVLVKAECNIVLMVVFGLLYAAFNLYLGELLDYSLLPK